MIKLQLMKNKLVAMKKKLKMIEKNQTFEFVDTPKHKKAIAIKWVYRTS